MRTPKYYVSLLGAALALVPALAQAQAPAPPPGDPLGPDVFQAISSNDIPRLNALLDKGAKPEAPNWLGFTPLIWAASMGNQAACDTLINHGANVKIDGMFGSLIEMAQMGKNPALVGYLIKKGATPSKNRVDRITALMVAAEQGQLTNMAQLLALKQPIDAADNAGNTALTYASRRGRLEAVRFLLAKGAQPTRADNDGRTALHYAAQNGHADVVRLLLIRGAKVNAKDKKNDTPYLLAARYSGDPAVLNMLKQSGATTTGKDHFGLTVAELSKKRTAPLAGSLAPQARHAVERSLPLVENSTRNFSKVIACASCHHQGVGLAATGTANKFRFAIAQDLATEQKALVTHDFQAALPQLKGLLPHPEMYKVLPTVDIKEYAPMVGTTFFGMTAHGAAKTEVTDAMATVLARQQDANGSWSFYVHRAPSQSSPFMTTALSVQMLAGYAPETISIERDACISKAKTWLLNTPAVSNEDRIYRLLGLRWSGASQQEIATAAAQLRSAQRPDGGWAQFPQATSEGRAYSRSDAYATGQALYALNIGGGMPVNDPVYQRGVKYLLRTQDEDGSWFVNKRAVPVNNYMDVGFPHGQSQFISYDATCWAIMALAPVAGTPSSVATK
ncbi:MAG: ankyrin repeat domain-containing protein [Armatimonas sp.]